MHSRYFRRPYRFVPPYRRTFWAHLARPFVAGYLKRAYGIERVEVRGLDRLRRSVDGGSGVLLAPNHCRLADPFVVGVAGRRVRRFFYYVASFHLFQGRRFDAWRANRLGAFSVLRDAPDRLAVQACVNALAAAERPVVMFPEGTYYRQNDRLGPIRGGLVTVCRRAARQSDRPIVIHPVAIKYWFLEEPRSGLDRRLAILERQLGCQVERGGDVMRRLATVHEAYLARQETAYLGRPQTGDVSQRMAALTETILSTIEQRHDSACSGTTFERINSLRRSRVKQMAAVADQKHEFPQLCQELDDLYLCQLMLGHGQDYLHELPGDERVAEAVQRIEEDLYDVDRAIAATGAVVEIGPPMVVDQGTPDRAADEALRQEFHSSLQEMLDRLVAEGPPAGWRDGRRRRRPPRLRRRRRAHQLAGADAIEAGSH